MALSSLYHRRCSMIVAVESGLGLLAK